MTNVTCGTSALKKKKKTTKPKDRNPFIRKHPIHSGARVVGGYIPLRLSDYIALVAIFRNTTISEILRGLFDEFEDKSEPEDHVIRVLANRAHTEWVRRLKERQDTPGWRTHQEILARYREYQLETAAILTTKRGVSDGKAQEIIHEMEEIYGLGSRINETY